MKKLNLLYVILSLVILSAACTPPRDDHFTDETNFPVKDLPARLSFDKNLKFIGGALFLDSTHKDSFVKLNPQQQYDLVVPVMAKESDMADTALNKSFVSYFIEKPARHGDLQPLVVCIGSFNYKGVKLIVLDKNNAITGSMSLMGGMDIQPSVFPDRTIFETDSYYHIDKDTITTYRINRTNYTDGKPFVLDSNVYKSVIKKDGSVSSKIVRQGKNMIPYPLLIN